MDVQLASQAEENGPPAAAVDAQDLAQPDTAMRTDAEPGPGEDGALLEPVKKTGEVGPGSDAVVPQQEAQAASTETLQPVVSLLDESQAVVLDEQGALLPLASDEAGELLEAGGDPWFLNPDDGRTHGYYDASLGEVCSADVCHDTTDPMGDSLRAINNLVDSSSPVTLHIKARPGGTAYSISNLTLTRDHLNIEGSIGDGSGAGPQSGAPIVDAGRGNLFNIGGIQQLSVSGLAFQNYNYAFYSLWASVSDVTISHNSFTGRTDGSSGGMVWLSALSDVDNLTFSNNIVTQNTYGIFDIWSDVDDVAITHNNFSHNGQDVNFLGSSTADVTITENWWGCPDGPGAPGCGSLSGVSYSGSPLQDPLPAPNPLSGGGAGQGSDQSNAGGDGALPAARFLSDADLGAAMRPGWTFIAAQSIDLGSGGNDRPVVFNQPQHMNGEFKIFFRDGDSWTEVCCAQVDGQLRGTAAASGLYVLVMV